MEERIWPYQIVSQWRTRYFRITAIDRGPGPVVLTVPEPGARSLVSSAHGKLTRVLFCLPTYFLQLEEARKSLCDLLSRLPSDLLIAFIPDGKKMVDELITDAHAKNRSTVVKFNPGTEITIWAQDAYMVATDSSKPNVLCFLEPYSFRRSGDSNIADKLEAVLAEVSAEATDVYFEGGNILVADDFYFVGIDHLDPVEQGAVATTTNMDDKFKMYLESQRQIHWIGGNPLVRKYKTDTVQINGKNWWLMDATNPGTLQPIFHIDMFLSLAGRKNGKYRILVGDPTMAKQLFDRDPDEPKLFREEDFKFARAERLDNIAQDLANQGFEVIRNPLPLIWTKLGKEKAKIYHADLPDDIEGIILYYFASYNNCLVEIPANGQPKVWLPTYGYRPWTELRVTDNLMVELWSRLGFKVEKLGNFQPFAIQGGALHCLAKDLNRA